MPTYLRQSILVLLCTLLWVPTTLGQAAGGAIGALNSQVDSAESDLGSDGDPNGEVKELLDRARQRLKTAEEFERQAKAFSDAASQAPGKIERLEREREQFSEASLPNVSELETVAELRGLLTQTELSLVRARQRANELSEQEAAENGVDIQERLNVLSTLDLPASAADDAQPAIRRAQDLFVKATRAVRTAEAAMLEQQKVSRGARLEVIDAERRFELQKITLLERQLDTINARLSRNLRSEAQALTEYSSTLLNDGSATPDVVAAAQRNVDLGEQLVTVLGLHQSVEQQAESYARESDRIRNRYQSLRVQLESTNLSSTPEFGAALRHYRDQLIDFERADEQIAQTQSRLTQARLDQFQLEAVGGADADIVEPQRRSNTASPPLVELTNDANRILKRLRSSYADYIDALTQSLTQHEQLLENSRSYADLIDKHLLWMPSAKPVSTATVAALPTGVSWLISTTNWRQISLADPAKLAVAALLFLLSFLALRTRSTAGSYLEEMSGRIGKVNHDRIRYSFEAVGLTLISALFVPLLIVAVSFLIDTSAPFANGVAGALRAGALVYFVLNTFQQSVREHGLGMAHFSWLDATLKVLRKHLTWFTVTFAVLIMLNVLLDVTGDAVVRDSLGRFVFIASTLLLAFFTFLVVRAMRSEIVDSLSSLDQSQRLSVRYLVLPFIVLLPVLVAVLSLLGYHYTAIVLDTKLIQSGVLFTVAVYAYYLALRWLSINERRYTLRSLKEQRARERAQQEEREAANIAGDAVPDTIDIERIDLQSISNQTKALVKLLLVTGLALGLWPIWSSLFSSFQTLDAIELYSTTDVIDGVSSSVPTTLWDVCLVLIVALITFVGAKNIPGSLEVAVLSRLKLQQGTSYAVTTLCRYLIAIVGAVTIFQLLGAQWSKIQWLVAALSVGLGFGLQEIVANFVSGIVLLFERPIRIGDTVSVGEQQGTVSKIRIRATTILDWDNKEVIIPNKNFITERLINWTLSDAITRKTITVGVAYGSDVPLAEKLLLEVAQDCEGVLDEPAPVALFLNFGASSLDFELRVFIQNVREILPVAHRLHKAIDKTFAEHGIEIAFPQQDVHFDDRPINVRLTSDQVELDSTASEKDSTSRG